jgi:hypothetical protein
MVELVEQDLTSPKHRPSTAEPARAPRSGTVTIRLADNLADWQGVIELMRQMHGEAELTRSPFSDKALRRTADRALAQNGHKSTCALLAERRINQYETELLGTIIGNAGEYFFSEAIGATAMAFYVRPENRGGMAAVKLLHAFRRWSDNRRATSISINVTSGIHMARTDKLLKRLGFQVSGGNYLQVLENNITAAKDTN